MEDSIVYVREFSGGFAVGNTLIDVGYRHAKWAGPIQPPSQ